MSDIMDMAILTQVLLLAGLLTTVCGVVVDLNSDNFDQVKKLSG